MTREEAIKRLEDTFEAWDIWVKKCPEDAPARLLNEALGMAISALREQEERSKVCEWCEKDRVLCWDSGGEEVCIAVQGKLPVLGTDDWGFAIKFCPMCGRRLENA